MMKTKLWCCLLLLTPIICYCQPNIPEYGKIDKADLTLTDCDFDNGATAFKLLDYGKVRFEKSKYLDEKDDNSRYLKVVTERRVRIKILKKEGLERANVKIPFYAKEEEVRKISGCTYNLGEDGKVVVSEVEKNGIYIQKVTKTNHQLIIVLPNVKVGSIIEYKYIIETENEFFVRDWYFQSAVMPTRLSYYDIHIPLTHGFGEEAYINHPSLVKKSEQLKRTYGEGTMQLEVPFVNRVFYLENVKAIKNEPHSGAVGDYLQRVYYHSVPRADNAQKGNMAHWWKLANMLSDKGGYDENVVATVNGSEALVEKARQQSDTVQKIKMITDYIRQNITCTKDTDIFPDEGANKVWQTRSGSIADINLLLVNLLQKAGVNALVFLGSTYDNGLVTTNYPSYKQFNILLCYVPTAKGFYLLDATNKEGLSVLAPWYILDTKGLVVNGDESVFVAVTDDNTRGFKQVVDINITMNDNAKATGAALIKSYDYAKGPRLYTWLHNKEKFASEYVAHPQFTISIDSIRINNEADDALPLEQQFNFTVPVSSSGNYHYITTNLFTSLLKNPFTDDERLTDVEFRYKQSYELTANITLPNGYVLEELPKAITLAMPDNSIECTRLVTVTDKTVQVKIALLFNTSFIKAKDYGFLKDFYKKLFNLLEEKIVVKKK